MQGTITKNNQGNVTLSGGTQAKLDGAVAINDGSLTLNGGNVTASSGNLSLTASEDITTNAPINLSGNLNMVGGHENDTVANITANAPITAGGNIDISVTGHERHWVWDGWFSGTGRTPITPAL